MKANLFFTIILILSANTCYAADCKSFIKTLITHPQAKEKTIGTILDSSNTLKRHAKGCYDEIDETYQPHPHDIRLKDSLGDLIQELEGLSEITEEYKQMLINRLGGAALDVIQNKPLSAIGGYSLAIFQEQHYSDRINTKMKSVARSLRRTINLMR